MGHQGTGKNQKRVLAQGRGTKLALHETENVIRSINSVGFFIWKGFWELVERKALGTLSDVATVDGMP